LQIDTIECPRNLILDERTFTVSIGLPNRAKLQLAKTERLYESQKHMCIHWNSPEIGGSRSVEVGFGPNPYKTYGELKEAITEALNSKRPSSHLSVLIANRDLVQSLETLMK
jgi:hypothetical protein